MLSRGEVRVGRPAGEVRLAIADALVRQPGATVREVAALSQVGYTTARYTISRMVAASEVLAVGVSDGAVMPVGRCSLVKGYALACRLPSQGEPGHQALVGEGLAPDLVLGVIDLDEWGR